jgi:hypothetical protein
MRKMLKSNRAAMTLLLVGARMLSAEEGIEKTIKDLYASAQAAARGAQTKEDVTRALSVFAPEWVGKMPAGETLTMADLIKEGESALTIPAEKRPLPKMDFVYIRETGWNVLVVYWNSRRLGTRIVGSLYRDTWVRTGAGWRQISREKFFPDRPLIENGKPLILPAVE